MWKSAFDSDPVWDERASGVRSYRILRAIDDASGLVMIDLEFDTQGEAEALLEAMRAVWQRVAGTLIRNPAARILQEVETFEY